MKNGTMPALSNNLLLNVIRLEELERFAERVNSSLGKSREETSQYLHHPVNIFQLLNRYYNGWLKLLDGNTSTQFSDLIANLSVQRDQFPSSEDFRGAAVALGRLQDTYNLTTAAIARGQVGNGSLLLTSKSHLRYSDRTQLKLSS